MVEKSKVAQDHSKSERAKRLDDKMRKAEMIAREKRAEREARIKVGFLKWPFYYLKKTNILK